MFKNLSEEEKKVLYEALDMKADLEYDRGNKDKMNIAIKLTELI